MSSWRNLMTPTYDKYHLQDSCSSSLSQSNLTKASSFRSKDPFQTSLYNERLQELQGQMSRLKGQLTKYSTKERTRNRPSLTPSDSLHQELLSDRIDVRQHMDFGASEQIQEESQTNNTEENDNVQFEVAPISYGSSNKYASRKKLADVMNDNPFDDSLFSKPSLSQIVSGDRIAEKENIKNDINSTKAYIGRKNINSKDGFLDDKVTTQKPTKKTFVFENEKTESKANSNEDSMRKTLADCCKQITELQQVAHESQNQIHFLCEELAKEKEKSRSLRDPVPRNSVGLSDQRVATPISEKTVDVTEYSYNSPNIQKEANHRVMRSRVRSNPTDQEIDLPCNESAEQRIAKRREESHRKNNLIIKTDESSVKDFSIVKSSAKDTGVQCDFLLDVIVNSNEDDDEQLETLRNKVDILTSDIEKIKGHKNDMIETFQQIVGILAIQKDSAKTKAKQGTHSDIKQSFSDFHSAFKAKMDGINNLMQPPTVQHKPESNFNGAGSTAFGRSRNNRTEISDNLMYSPSNTFVSFDEELMESKYNILVNTFKTGSPMVQKTIQFYPGKPGNHVSPRNL